MIKGEFFADESPNSKEIMLYKFIGKDPNG